MDSTSVVLDATTGPRQIDFDTDLTACLADAAREGGGNTCPVRIRLMIRNGNRDLLDSLEVDRIDVEPGQVRSAAVATGVLREIGPTGGTLTSDDGNVSLVIPPGALSLATTLSIRRVTSPPADTRVVPGTVYEIRPTNTVFAVAASLTINFLPTAVPGGPSRATGLRLGKVNSEHQWEFQPQTRPTFANTTATVPVTTLGTVGLLVATPRIAAGYYHTCRLDPAGAACWGNNEVGQLGTGTMAYHFAPAPVSTTRRFERITTGDGHSCGVTDALEAFCWGNNPLGELGNGGQVSSNVPVAVQGGHQFVAVSAGTLSSHTCGLSSGGQILCWGGNFNGQLGIGSTTPQFVLQPGPVAGGHLFVDVAVGFLMSCGLSTLQEIFCWGSDIAGQLGSAAGFGTVPTPTLVSGGLHWSAVSVGAAHVCALTTAGKAYCWGQNAAGEIGDPNVPISQPPNFSGSNVPHPVVGGHTFQNIAAGNTHTCAIEVGGDVYCWGSNVFGQLAEGPSVTSRATPTLVPLGEAAVSVSAGIAHTCVETVSGRTLCWGYNSYGQLATGTSGLALSPVPLRGGLSFSSLADGGPSCGTVGGTTYCWGPTPGDGAANATAPVPVTGGPFGSLASGRSASCGLTPARTLFCWGSILLGDGSPFANRAVPTLSAPGFLFDRVTVGGTHVCGLDSTGTAFCWGDNLNGEVGDGTRTSRLTPVQVTGPTRFVSLVAGVRQTCGLTTVGDAFCWGPFPNSAAIPTQVGIGQSFSQAAIGASFGCLLEAGTGRPYCWGSNDQGQLGNGSVSPAFAQSLAPVVGGLAFVELAAGDNNICGRTAAGQVYCWGSRRGGTGGDGSSSFAPAVQPTVVPGLVATAVRVGQLGVCALTPSGTVACWGNNISQRLGVQTEEFRATPTPVP